MKTRLSRWGTSLGIRIPKDVLDTLGWRENDKIEVARTGKKLTLENAEQSRIMTDWQKMMTVRETHSKNTMRKC